MVGSPGGKKSGDAGLIPGSGRSPGESNGNPPQYSCLENSSDRRAWRAIVHGVAKSRHNLVIKNNYYGKCQLKAQNVVQWENPEQSAV